jgi:hypothetical protein
MDVVRQVLSVLLVFSLLGAALWALRRGGRIGFAFKGLTGKGVLGKQRSMVVVERLALTPQHTLHAIRINGHDVLVATYPQGCSVVTQLAATAERAMGAQA